MAISSTIAYCENNDLLDIYPGISEFDLKRRLYNFSSQSISLQGGSTAQIYYTRNVGKINNLFIDGKQLQEGQTLSSTAHGTLGATLASGATSVTVSAENTIPNVDVGTHVLVRVESEIAHIHSCNGSGDTSQTWTRGQLGTVAASHASGTSISNTLLTYDSGNFGSWAYDSVGDLLLLHWNSDLNESIVEAGDDWDSIKTRFMRKASRLIESYLDSRMSREILKDREGNYPEIIVHATALQTVLLLLKAHDPNNEIIAPFQEELNEILDGLKSGSIVLPTAISSDSSKGVIREVSVNSNSDLRPVELKGNYNTYGYDLIKLKIISGGLIGASTYSVWVKDSNTLKNKQVVTEEKVTGDYDLLDSGLYVRFGGDDVSSAITTTNDEYEIEVHSSSLNASISAIGSVTMTRR